MAINPKIKQKAEDIRSKIFGSEVRESLASGIESISEDVEATIGRQGYVEEQFQNVLDETTGKDVISAPELIAARNGKSNLKTRLDEEHAQVTAQLQQTEQELNAQLAQNTYNGKQYKFDTVNEMVINSNKLKNGDVVELGGYYSFGDGGGHTRLITTTSNLVSVNLGDGLYANPTGIQDDLRYFGIVLNDESKREVNSPIFINVLKHFNGFVQKEELKNEIVYLQNVYYTIPENNFNYKNINANVKVTSQTKDYIIGIESSISYITMKNFVFTNPDIDSTRENMYKMYAVKLAHNANGWGGAKYMIENGIIQGFSVPLFTFCWTSSIKNVNFRYTDTGAVLLGTSNDISNLYVNDSMYGNILGAIYNIATDTFSFPSHAILDYSNIAVLANDHIRKNVLILGRTSGVTISSIGTEKPVSGIQSIFKPLINGFSLNVNNVKSAQSSKVVPYIVYADEGIAFTFNIETLTDNYTDNLKNQDTVIVNLKNNNALGLSVLADTFKEKLVMDNNKKFNGVPLNRRLSGISKNIAGGSNSLIKGSSYEFETFITANQRIKIPILPILFSGTASARRNFALTLDLVVTDVDKFNSKKVNNKYLITALSSTYTQGTTVIEPIVNKLAETTDNLVIEVDITGEYPTLVIQLPTDASSNAGTYYLNAKVFTGVGANSYYTGLPIVIENY